MTYPDILSITRTAERCKAEGIPLSEKAIRRFVKNGSLPAVRTGKKALIYFPNVKEFIKQGNNQASDPEMLPGKIRPIRA